MTSYSPDTAPESPPRSTYGPEPTGWTGWIAFAGVIMVMLGALHAIQGFVALFKDEYFLVGKNGLIVNVDYTQWGWTQLIFGVVVALAGFSLLAGRMWARIVAVIVAFLSVLLNIGFLAAFPIWSTIMIVLDVLIIWAVMVHGREMKSV
jgi:hypothetical protein